ncbi:MAG TPA: elongation factor P maturation arginine rhamnosyltransferase EarP [Casimicrobiaceae bacterium]
MAAQRYDIFCKVVDNYGDAGVSWRLARQLVREHEIAVTLWIDALPSLAKIAPGIDPTRDVQSSNGVRVRAWQEAFLRIELPDVVIEAFGCGLPDAYVDAMATAQRAPIWVNLEYLSAEPWVESAHALPSAQPRLPLTRYFYFPGFTDRTGGLLREAGLLEARERAQEGAGDRDALWRLLGLSCAESSIVVSLFCYANASLPSLLDAWAEGDESVFCLVPEGVATASLDGWTGGNVPHAGQTLTRGRLSLATLPFVAQDDYDRLLWQCDVNIVRGEDSFVRAQWAARPFVWHIYPQADDAHRVKLEEFLRRFEIGLDPHAAEAVNRFWLAFNDNRPDAAALEWAPFRAVLPQLRDHGRRWADRLRRHRDLATGLVEFCDARL